MENMQDFKEEISEWQRNLKVNNNLQEVDEGLKTIHTVEDESKV